MKVPLSWMKDYVEITLPVEELAHRLTMAGLEVEEVIYVGLPLPLLTDPERIGTRPGPDGKLEGQSGGHMEKNSATQRPETKISGIEWQADKIVVAAVYEVMPHPNADRLVLCRLYDGAAEHIVLTGAPNLYPYKGLGELDTPLKVAYAREGAQIFDGHQPGQVLTTLKRARIRGVESYSMICSEKELGISDDHEGVIILDEDAPVGMPLVDYMGDVVLDIAIMPNIARDANIVGVARELAALTHQELRIPSFDFQADGPAIEGKVTIQIENPELNPRFVLGLIQDVQIGPSPYWVQRRLRLAGMRPINNIVDATNYTMLELGEPLHAFDYDVLVQRAGGRAPTIITRTAMQGERLTTLDDVERTLDEFTVLVCDTAGALSIAGVMGGSESEVNEKTRNVLLEGASWNYINIRRTLNAQHMNSEAAYRFSRGVHPAIARRGVGRCLEWMHQWSGGVVAQGLVDNYPLPVTDPQVEVTVADVQRWLGIEMSLEEIADILRSLEFKVEGAGPQRLRVTTPDHRLDIGTGIVGVADLMEEIARIYGYDRIPETRLSDGLPPQRSNASLEREERVRDLLVDLGLQEVVTYRMTTPEREARRFPAGRLSNLTSVKGDVLPYVRIANPITVDRDVLRHSLLASLLEVVEKNARIRDRLALFEIGPIFLPNSLLISQPDSERTGTSPERTGTSPDRTGTSLDDLPQELLRLGIVLTGPRAETGWKVSSRNSSEAVTTGQGGSSRAAEPAPMDFFDLKGILSALFDALHLVDVRYQESQDHPSFHPGKCAKLMLGDLELGVIGELHPLVRQNYELPPTPLVAVELDLQLVLDHIPQVTWIQPVPAYPPVLEDVAVILDDTIPAERVEQTIRQGGGEMLVDVRLFDVYRGKQIGEGKKSLAYSLTYQAPDRTLTDEEAARIRQRIIRQLDQDLGAYLRQ